MKPAFSETSFGTSMFTAPMPPIEGGFAFAAAMNSCSVLTFESLLTRSSMSSEASRATGVKLVGPQPVLACSGVVMKLPLVLVMCYGLPFWPKTKPQPLAPLPPGLLSATMVSG